jgi:hypothetical protein
MLQRLQAVWCHTASVPLETDVGMRSLLVMGLV